ncbi:hypothetical protein IIA15_00305 [candidate division TA06 bacterium]|nr:hypothetical protein [candidate division TA06 bacterium]
MKWKEFLSLKKRSITELEWRDAEQDAKRWPSCYIGENKERLRRLGIIKLGVIESACGPNDTKLFGLGLDFNDMIQERDLASARETAKKIDRRIKRLEAKQEKEKK